MITRKTVWKIFGIILILISSLTIVNILDGQIDYQNSEEVYGSGKIVAESQGSLVHEIPGKNLIEGEMAISPELPRGLSLFQESWEISGRLTDNYEERVCIIIGDGSVSCWDDSALIPEFPVFISPKILNPDREAVFSSISVGFEFACGVLNLIDSAPQLFCWGTGDFGAMDYEEITQSGTTNIVKINRSGWTHISVGKSHACGVINNTEVYCWGDGAVGQLGIGEAVFSSTPMLVTSSPNGILQIESGAFHTCILHYGGYVDCWGWNSHGQIGSGEDYESRFPSRISIPPEPDYSLSLGELFSCLISDSKSHIVCWGDNRENQISSLERDSFDVPQVFSLNQSGTYKLESSDSRNCILFGGFDLTCYGEGIDNDGLEISFSRIAEEILPLDGKVCLIDVDRRIFCKSYDSSPHIRGLPIGIYSFIVPNEITRGTISGIPVGEFIGDFSLIDSTGSIIGEFRIEVSFGLDTDSDGWSDKTEIGCNSDPNNTNVVPIDTDGDWVCDRFDLDDDGDGHPDNIDRFPYDATEWRDDDRDGIGRNSDSYEISPGMKSGLMTLSILFIVLMIEVISIRSDYFSRNEFTTTMVEEE